MGFLCASVYMAGLACQKLPTKQISKIENDSRDMKSWLIYFTAGSAEQLQIKILSRLGESGISVSELKKGKALADEISEIIKSNN